VLNKSTHLSQNEFELIKHHVTKGNEILKDFDSIQGLSEGALYHREKFDGSSYTFGLNGQSIPFRSTLGPLPLQMSMKRPYQDALPHETILSEFTKFSGIQFDPVILQVMCKLIESNAIHALNEDGSDDVVESVN
jgi:HD-GYP domain-containing protein (c-di-GMP phosphodiesterase class II)